MPQYRYIIVIIIIIIIIIINIIVIIIIIIIINVIKILACLICASRRSASDRLHFFKHRFNLAFIKVAWKKDFRKAFSV